MDKIDVLTVQEGYNIVQEVGHEDPVGKHGP